MYGGQMHENRGRVPAGDHWTDSLRTHLRHRASHLLGPAARRLIDSEDAAQQALLKGAESPPAGGFPNDKARRGWFTRVLHNLIRDVGRRQRTVVELDPAHFVTSDTPSTRATKNEESRNALSLLDALAPREREVVRLRTIEELSYEEIANRLGIQVGHARVVHHRALEKLRRNAERDDAS